MNLNLNLVGAVFGLAMFAGQALAASKYDCKVVEVRPENANFFAPRFSQISPPIAGDGIQIDLLASEITDLTFQSGNAVALALVQAKLLRQSETRVNEVVYLGNYSGQFKYVGSLIADTYNDPESHTDHAEVTLSVSNLSNLQTHQLMMNCDLLP
ncbi:MAG: hypothetical protein NTV34_10180 [Proteobacteria bacterium]|nr:hypothetical protein [Pseudomonadota bacterium]